MHTGSGIKPVVKVISSRPRISADPRHQALLFHKNNASNTEPSPGSIWRSNMRGSGSPLVIAVSAEMNSPDDGHETIVD